jgi:hypothetical protein
VDVAAGGEHEQRAPKRRVALDLVERHRLSGYVREDDELDSLVSRSGTRLRSSRA